MKKLNLLFIAFVVLYSAVFGQNEVLVGWTFPGNSAIADTGINVNLDKEIYTVGGTSNIEFKNGYETKAAQASGWDDGMDLKAWVISFSTENYSNLTISSMQSSGGNDPGPKNFKIQYSIDVGSTWFDLESGDIIVENDWTTGVIDNLTLPNECQDQAEVIIRLIMTTNEASGAGGSVLETGKSKIDEIYIRGEVINGINEIQKFNLTIGPNPVRNFIRIQADIQLDNLILTDLSGRNIIQKQGVEFTDELNISGLPQGTYVLIIKNAEQKFITSRKIFVY